MMEAVRSNADHPEYGVATIPLPIPRNQYDHCVALLEALEIGDASEADCRLDSLDSAWPVLNRLVCTKVNLDELDYLAKRLDSFTVGEFSQFQAMAEKLNLTSMKDLINLTFCCQQATVITDFTNLKEVGRDHYMNIHGGCASMEELEQLDGVETAVLLIEDNEGTITRYGVVYDNGMQLSQLYDGKHLPCYHYEADMTAVGISTRWEPENSRNVTWIYLPASKGQIERAMQRSGIADPKDMRLFIADSSFPEEVDVVLDFQCDNIHELNELALAVEKFSIHDRKKLGAAVSMAKPENASQIRRLAENMDLFEFAPGAHTPEEYGKYMIQRSGHFEYDPNLDEFYDYERYGLQHMDYQSGVFTDRGYIAYVGTVDLEELKLLYEDADYHNAVFVGTDEDGVPRHTHKRSANSFGKAFRLNVEGCDPRHSFHHIGTDESLYVFEAPIDMLSYITLHPEGWQSRSYVACCGTSIQPVLKLLERQPEINTVLLCLDNDEAGHLASRRMKEQLAERYTVERLIPAHKDWNDDLTAEEPSYAQVMQ